MGKSTSLVKATIVNLVDTGTEVPKWVLTSFNDPAVHIAKVTENPEELKSAVLGLSFFGGDDTPEQALQGEGIVPGLLPPQKPYSLCAI